MPVLKISSRVQVMIVRKQGKQAIGVVRTADVPPMRLPLRLGPGKQLGISYRPLGWPENGKKSKGATLGQNRSGC